MEHLNYIEINIICLLLLFIVLFRQYGNHSIVSSSQISMRRLIVAACVLCVSDTVAILVRGHSFDGARTLIQISNLVYLESMPIISMFWLRYVYSKIGRKVSTFSNVLIITPIVLFTILAVTNPFTKILFSVNESNLYVRGPGVFIHWIVSWIYLFVATIMSYLSYRAAQSWNKKAEYRPLLLFIILPTICCVIQMLVYGLTIVQVGVTLTIVLVNLQTIDNRISIDELTGVGNRKEMNLYVDRIINRYKPVQLCVFMIDVNRFKQINDTYGHNVGDDALREIATALKDVCENFSERLFVGRYGGDEFVIVGRDITNERIDAIKKQLQNEVNKIHLSSNIPCELSISVGSTIGMCEKISDFQTCIIEADKLMYIEKDKYKKSIQQ